MDNNDDLINPHISFKNVLVKFKTWRNTRKYLKQFGLTRSQIDDILKKLDVYERLKKRD